MKSLLLVAATIGAMTVLGARRPEAPSEPTHSVWDSVYTEAQSVRGDSLYRVGCATCHGATLAGTDDGTPLTGDAFLGNWNGLTLAELYDKIRSTMPPETPETIPPDQVTGMLAYLLAQNHFPPGKTALTADVDRLKDIKVVASRP